MFSIGLYTKHLFLRQVAQKLFNIAKERKKNPFLDEKLYPKEF